MRKEPIKLLTSDYKVAAVATVIVIIGVCMRVYGLGSQGLHCEELFTIPAATGQHYVYLKSETALRMDSFPTTRQEYTSLVTPRTDRGLGDVTNVLRQNVHMPFYFYFMYYWVKAFGVSEVSLRIPSVIFGSLAVLMMFLLARELVNPFTSLIATVFVALMPEQIFYSQEARMYSLLVLLVISSTYLVFVARRRQLSTSILFLYSIVSLIGLYTHYVYLFCFAFQALFIWIDALSQKEKRIPWKWLIFQALITTAVLPWLLIALTQKQASPEMLAWARADPTLQSVVTSIGTSLTRVIAIPELKAGWLTAVVAYLLLALGMLRLHSKKNVLLLCGLWVTAIVVGIVFIDLALGTKAIGVTRYWLVITPALYLLMASGLDKLRSIQLGHEHVVPAVSVGVVILLLTLGAFWTASGSLRPKPDRYRELAQVIQNYTVSQRKEAIFTEGSNAIALALGYYSRRNINVLRAAYVMDQLKTKSIGEVFDGSDIWLIASGESGAKVFLESKGYRMVNQPVQFGHIQLYAFKAPQGGDSQETKTK